MKRFALSVALIICTACGAPSTTESIDDVESAASRTKFDGSYTVPVTDELAAAATYSTSDIRWSVKGGVAELDYDLPRGLVGRDVAVHFTGSFDPKATTQHLEGDAGTAECTVTETSVSCFETMYGLLPLEPNLQRIKAIAQQEHAGPAQERVDVAKLFAVDPLGIVRFDLPATSGAKKKRTDDR